MAWQDEADKYANKPVVLVAIDFNSGTRQYSMDYIHIGKDWKGNILSMTQITNSIGDIQRTFERGHVSIVFSDTDYEFRGLYDSESPHFKGKRVIISVYFPDSGDTLAVHTGSIYNWRFLDNLQFELIVEPRSKNLENYYPDRTVKLSNWANAHPTCLSKPIPIPLGPIMEYDLANTGAFCWPGLRSSTGCALVDTTLNAERHLVAEIPFVEEVTNGGFASDVSSWDVMNSATLASVAGGQAGNCCQITENGANDPGLSQSITLEMGSVYILSFYIKQGTETGYNYQVLRDSDSAVIASGSGVATGSWVRVTAEFNVDMYYTWTNGNITVEIWSDSLNGEGKTLLVDSVSIYELCKIYGVFKDGVSATGNYSAAYEINSGYVQALIDWASGQNPGESNLITCDIWAGRRRPVQGIYYFLTTYCGYVASNFDSTLLAAALSEETTRAYYIRGAVMEGKPLRSILDEWRDEFELDIYWNKAGEVCFKYGASSYASDASYNELTHILKGYYGDTLITEIVNKIDYGLNYNFAKDFYYTQNTNSNSTSITKHGGTFSGPFKGFRWIRDSDGLSGMTEGTDMAADIIARKIARLCNPPAFDRFIMPLACYSDDLGDVLSITHFCGTGSSGYSGAGFQIRRETLNLNNFTKEVLVEKVTLT